MRIFPPACRRYALGILVTPTPPRNRAPTADHQLLTVVYFFCMQGYVLGAGAITASLSPPFGKLMAEEQQLEGEYRQLQSRVRTHSESIAFYGGQDREGSLVTQRFKKLTRHAASEWRGDRGGRRWLNVRGDVSGGCLDGGCVLTTRLTFQGVGVLGFWGLEYLIWVLEFRALFVFGIAC